MEHTVTRENIELMFNRMKGISDKLKGTELEMPVCIFPTPVYKNVLDRVGKEDWVKLEEGELYVLTFGGWVKILESKPIFPQGIKI